MLKTGFLKGVTGPIGVKADVKPAKPAKPALDPNFREYTPPKAPPIREPLRTGPDAQYVLTREYKGITLVRERYTPGFLSQAVYRDEHFLGIYPQEITL